MILSFGLPLDPAPAKAPAPPRRCPHPARLTEARTCPVSSHADRRRSPHRDATHHNGARRVRTLGVPASTVTTVVHGQPRAPSLLAASASADHPMTAMTFAGQLGPKPQGALRCAPGTRQWVLKFRATLEGSFHSTLPVAARSRVPRRFIVQFAATGVISRIAGVASRWRRWPRPGTYPQALRNPARPDGQAPATLAGQRTGGCWPPGGAEHRQPRRRLRPGHLPVSLV